MALKTHMRVLAGNTDERWVDAAFKVAFASSDMRTVNQHFGFASALVVYAVDPGHSKLLEVFKFSDVAPDADENKLIEKLAALEGCIALYAQAIGAAAVGHLKAHGIHPVKVHAGAEIKELLEVFQAELRLGPSAWLAKAIRANSVVDPGRFNEMEADGWEE